VPSSAGFDPVMQSPLDDPSGCANRAAARNRIAATERDKAVNFTAAWYGRSNVSKNAQSRPPGDPREPLARLRECIDRAAADFAKPPESTARVIARALYVLFVATS
jgi:hypothetical protein